MFKINKSRVGTQLCPRGLQTAWADDKAVYPPYHFFENKFALLLYHASVARPVYFSANKFAIFQFRNSSCEITGDTFAVLSPEDCCCGRVGQCNERMGAGEKAQFLAERNITLNAKGKAEKQNA